MLLGCSILPTSAQSQTQWQPVAGGLMTRWARDVSPQNTHSEYPRPQMKRRAWSNLNGLWEYSIQAKDAQEPAAYEGKILVPFPVESALSGVKKRVSNEQQLWYRRRFEVPAAWNGQRTILHFGAVDWHSRVFVNGRMVGEHQGGYDRFSFDITNALKPRGPQELVVSVFDPTDKAEQPRGKQVSNPSGIYYTPVTGIWQTVWLEPVPSVSRITNLVTTPDTNLNALRLTVRAAGAGDNLQVSATAFDGTRRVSAIRGEAGTELRMPISKAKLWSPSKPFLYRLRVDLHHRGKLVDQVDSYFAMRKIALGKDAQGITRLLLNNQFVFQVGPLDQGFWPDGIYTAPSDEALRYDIEATKRLGFNMTRKHVKVEPDRWYYWADKLGLLVWQDMPSGGRSISGNAPDLQRSPESARQFEQELKSMMDGLRNHPSIIMWVVFNEGWGQFDTPRIVSWTKNYDPSRLVNNASGWTDRSVGDVIDWHRYPAPASPAPEATRAAVLGEYGGLGLTIEGHMWQKEAWGYQGLYTLPRQLTRTYVEFMRQVHGLKTSPGLSAAVYTQLTDVEGEANGLLTYDRAVIKPDIASIAAANRGDFSRLPADRVLIPTSQTQPLQWRYTFDKPGENWIAPEFDDASWRTGEAGFGTQGTPGSVVRTVWNSSDIWLRREVTLPALTGDPLLMLHHDEDAEIYINGVLAAKVTGYTSGYQGVELNAAGRAALKPGRNLIAVHCHQTGGGQYIDLGIVEAVNS
ncbi:MAG TPA: glycoside hydrolase family 2 TIM barrel-domain containing protein [Abditibacteriaceae bacterium]